MKKAGSCVGVSIGTIRQEEGTIGIFAWRRRIGEARTGLWEEIRSITDDWSHVITSSCF